MEAMSTSEKFAAVTAALRACPMCGAAAELRRMPKTMEQWRVRCVNWQCGATVAPRLGLIPAVEAWNRRREAGGT